MSDYGGFAHGSADRPHDTTTSDPWSPSYTTVTSGQDTMPPELLPIIQMALAQNGVDARRLSLSQVYRIAQMVWQDPAIQGVMQQYTVQSYTSVTDFVKARSPLLTAITNEMFNPALSSNSPLLSLGLTTLQQQGKNLSPDQSKYLGSAGTQVPRPWQGNFPIPRGGDHSDGDPGIDYDMPVGTQISTPFAGTISLDRSGKANWGNRVLVHLSNGYTFAVGHLTSMSVQDGQTVNPGDIIGYSGGDTSDPNSGDSTGPHIEVMWIDPGGHFLDPHPIVDPILAGTTFGQIGETGAMGTGVITPAKFPGDDPALDAQYPGVVSIWQKYYGSPPTGTQIRGIVGSFGSLAGNVPAGTSSVTQLAQQVGFTADEAKIVAAISLAESGGNPGRDQFPGQNYGGIGLMQIEAEAHPDLLAKYGGISGLHDPLKNLQAAYEVFVNAGRSFSPWTTFTQGVYRRFLGQDPSVSTQGGSANPGQLDTNQIEDTIRGLPSHIPGMNNGQYYDLRSMADSISQQYLGHASTDGIVAELFASKQTGKSDVDLWYKTHTPNEINSADYQKIYQANQPYLASVYNANGFDPRWAQQQYTQSQPQPQDAPPLRAPAETPSGLPLPGQGRGHF